MAESKVSICNRALQYLKVERINSLDETTEQARVCQLMYEGALASLLREHAWNFARAVTPLTPAAKNDNPEWAQAYALPGDCLRALRVFGAPGTLDPSLSEILRDAEARFEIIGGTVYTDLAQAYIEYVSKASDPTCFDACFSEILSLKLAADMAMSLTGNAEYGSYYAQRAAQALGRAKEIDAGEARHRKPVRPSRSSFSRARA